MLLLKKGKEGKNFGGKRGGKGGRLYVHKGERRGKDYMYTKGRGGGGI
mgnify:CR=1 FL=1